MIGYEGYESATAIKSGSVGATSALTIPAAATGAVIVFDTSDDAGPEAADTVTFGAVACTNVGFDTSAGAVTSGGGMWWCPDIRGRADDVVRYFSANSGNAAVRVIYFSAAIPLLRDTNAYTSKYNGGNQYRYQSSDASVPTAGGNQLAVLFAFQYGGSASAPGSTLLYGGGTKGLSIDLGAADEAVQADIYMTGGSFWGWYFGTTVYESYVEFNVSPDPLPLQLVFKVGAFALSGDVVLPGAKGPAMQLVFKAGRLGIATQRQVALVGEDIDTSEMTSGGDDGQLLTQHVDQPPTWEDADGHVHLRRWVPAVFRPDPVGSPDDWQLLHADDGSVVMTWVED